MTHATLAVKADHGVLVILAVRVGMVGKNTVLDHIAKSAGDGLHVFYFHFADIRNVAQRQVDQLRGAQTTAFVEVISEQETRHLRGGEWQSIKAALSSARTTTG